MPCWVLLLKLVGAWPALTAMFTVPPDTFMPSWCLAVLPALVTVTPCRMFKVPFATAMPVPPVF